MMVKELLTTALSHCPICHFQYGKGFIDRVYDPCFQTSATIVCDNIIKIRVEIASPKIRAYIKRDLKGEFFEIPAETQIEDVEKMMLL